MVVYKSFLWKKVTKADDIHHFIIKVSHHLVIEHASLMIYYNIIKENLTLFEYLLLDVPATRLDTLDILFS